MERLKYKKCLDFILCAVWRTFSRAVVSDFGDRHFALVSIEEEFR